MRPCDEQIKYWCSMVYKYTTLCSSKWRLVMCISIFVFNTFYVNNLDIAEIPFIFPYSLKSEKKCGLVLRYVIVPFILLKFEMCTTHKMCMVNEFYVQLNELVSSMYGSLIIEHQIFQNLEIGDNFTKAGYWLDKLFFLPTVLLFSGIVRRKKKVNLNSM